jgi:hypothetical protein
LLILLKVLASASSQLKEAQLTIGAEELPQSKQAKKGEIDVMPQAPKNTASRIHSGWN